MMKKGNGANPPARTLSGWVDTLLQDNFNNFFNDSQWGFRGLDQQVPVNLRETDKTYEMELVAPGLKKEDFKINVSNNQFTVSVEHKEEKKDEEEEGWIRNEYRMQSFSRSFTLDDTIDPGKIEATYQNGLLHVTLPKKENAHRISKTIEVK
jgi:HSP20 family protein